MKLNKLIIETLSPLGQPVCFQKYSGKLSTYITFHEYHTKGELFDDDVESYTGHYVQIDIWSKEDLGTLALNAKKRLEIAGFKRLDEIDLYESDTGLYHKGMRFFFLEEQEVG